MADNGPLYMGFDLSTQQLKGIVVDAKLKLIHEAKVDFDDDFGHKYGVQKGVLTNPAEGEVFAPPAMWLDAVNLVLDRLREAGHDFSRVAGLSGAGMQHGTVFWSQNAEQLLENLDPGRTLTEQLEPAQLLSDLDARKTVHQQLEPDSKPPADSHSAFAHPVSPNWQDASTQAQCDAFDAHLGSPETLAEVTGSKAHHRFSGPQILRYRNKYPSHYQATARISLVSSFLASVFLGRIAPIDVSDVTGMNLWDLASNAWDERLLELTAGGKEHVAELRKKLGEVSGDGGTAFGPIAPYFAARYGFPRTCQIIPFTGDNPATILALPLRAADAMVSLGTSTTFLMSTPHFKPDPAYHFMNHPTTRGLYMFMLCYKNGGLAREEIRDQLNAAAEDPDSVSPNSWDAFNRTALATSPLDQTASTDPMHLGLYFPRPEIVPNLPAGQWRRAYDPRTGKLSRESAGQENTSTKTAAGTDGDGGATDANRPKADFIPADARKIVESQFLSLRLRSHNLVQSPPASSSSASSDQNKQRGPLPPQPRRVYLVGGGSANTAIARLAGEVLGSADGVFRLDIGGNACALGSAYKAVWGCERYGSNSSSSSSSSKKEGGMTKEQGQSFEELIGARWDEAGFVERIADGYAPGVFERYGEAVKGFEMMEAEVLAEVAAEKGGKA